MRPFWTQLFAISITTVAFGSKMLQETRGIAVYQPPVEAFAQLKFDADASRGLFVGISKFSEDEIDGLSSDRFANIPYAVDDAVDMAHFYSLHLKLINPKGTILCLAGTPKKEESRVRLQQLLSAGAVRQPPERNPIFELLSRASRESRPEGMLVVSFATHGMSLQGSDYLAALDSSPQSIANTGLEVNSILNEVAQSNTQRRLVFLDACRERLRQKTDRRAGGVDKESEMGQAFAEAITNSSGMVVMAGARAGGYAYDDRIRRNGVFTASILEGLAGDAPADGRGFITPGNLAKTVNEKVCEWARSNRQTPPDQCGITIQIEGLAADLPLAVDPGTFLPPQEYQRRAENIRKKLLSNFGKLISGEMLDRVDKALPEYYPPEMNRRRLLDELFDQAQDLSPHNQVRFVPYLSSWFERWNDIASPTTTPTTTHTAADPISNKREDPSPKNGSADITSLGGARITVRFGDSKGKQACRRLSQAGLEVDCKKSNSPNIINKLILKCPDLPKQTGDILKSFLGLKQLDVEDYRRRNLSNRTICNLAGGAVLNLAK